MKKPEIRKADIIITTAFLLIAVCAFITADYFNKGTPVAEIIADGETIETISLTEHENRTIRNGNVTIEVRDGAIAITSSDCFGQDCVHTGFISRAGEISACLPNRILIRITGGSSNMPDAVSY